MKPDKFNQRPTIRSARRDIDPQPTAAHFETVAAPEYDVEPEVIKDRFLNKRNVIIGSVVIFVILIVLTVLFVSQIGKTSQVSVHKTTDSTCPSEPAYPTLTPQGRPINEFGGWTPGCPPGSMPSYAFSDQVGDASVVITEQKLPKDLEKNPTKKIKDIARSYNAADKLSTKNLTAYIGTNADGPQSVIATDGKLLILIQSKSIAPDDAWSDYLDSLQTTR